jgi:poly(3-hydroxybutyrate) depolymerase
MNRIVLPMLVLCLIVFCVICGYSGEQKSEQPTQKSKTSTPEEKPKPNLEQSKMEGQKKAITESKNLDGEVPIDERNPKVRLIPYGTALDPQDQIRQSRQFAKSVAKPDDPKWQAKGDQRRTYRFPETSVEIPYRIYVPTTWDGKSKLPLVVMLHGGGGNESMYLDQNNKQLLKLAEQHGYLLVSPMGYSPSGAYGTCLRLPAVFGQPEEAVKMRSALTPEKERDLERSEKDVINVLEMVLNEYPVDLGSMFLTGHSMGSGGTWYLGAKYCEYWAAIAPMSGPFVEEANYPWDRVRQMPIFMTEGTGATPSLAGSRKMRDWMKEHEFKIEYKEVDANHPGMVPLVLPDVFDFFDRYRAKNSGGKDQPGKQ